MNTPIQYFLIFALGMTVCGQAFAGRGIIVGNGGQTVECTSADGNKSLESFDLFEGRVHFNYNYLANTGEDPVRAAQRLAKKIDDAQGRFGLWIKDAGLSVSDRVKVVAKRMTLLPAGQALEPTGDASEYQIFPDGCKLIQTIDFRNPHVILVNSDVWNAIGPMDRTALYLHEAVYWFLRQSRVEHDSRRARAIVAYLVAGNELTPVDRLPVDAEPHGQFCHSVKRNSKRDWNTQFWAYRTTTGDAVIQMLQAGGFRFFNQVLLRNPLDKNDPELPIDAGSEKVRQLTGLSRFPVDAETVLQLTWGKGKIQLDGEIQLHTPVSDEITCGPWAGGSN